MHDVMVPAPAELAVLAAVIRDDAALLALIEHYGGGRVNIPSRVTATSKLVRQIGLPATRALAAEWPREKINVPLAKNWRIRVYHARGDGIAEIALRLSVARSTVQRVVARSNDWRPARERCHAANQMQLRLPG